MSACANCGVQLLAEASFCSACGASTDGTDSEGGLESNSPKKGRSTLAIVLIVCAVLFGLFIMFIAIVATIAVPQLLDARRNSNQRATIGSLRALATDQEVYKADNTHYTTIEKLAKTNGVDLTLGKAGYVFHDLIKAPNADFYAILASPKIWGSTGNKHFIICNEVVVREFKEKDLPFELSLPASQSSIDLINKFTQEAK